MKASLLLLMLFMIGCRVVINDPPTPKNIMPSITIGFTDDVSLMCSREEANTTLIWVECKFTNESNHIANVCVDVIYRHKDTGVYVSAHTKTCSGALSTNVSRINYAAFTKKEIDSLYLVCGNDLSQCKLSFRILEYK